MDERSNVTVIIPCYNDGDFIEQALDSILNQTLKAEKVIIIDDGSDRKTRKILEGIHINDVEIIFQENKGVSNARNTGIKLSKTDYILNLDADDYFEPTFIEKAVRVLNSNSTIGVVGSLVKVLKKNSIESEIIKPLGGKVKDFIVKNNGLGNSMFRKKCWEEVSGYDENMINGFEDWEFWIAVLRNNWSMYILQEPLSIYRIKKQSRDKTALRDFDFELRKYIFLKHESLFLEHYKFYVLELLRINCGLRKKQSVLKNSLNYKFGKSLLFPFRFLLKMFKKLWKN